MSWKDGGQPYLPTLAAAEDRFAIPRDLLARIAYQESHWRAAVIDSEEESSAGCVGLMQLNPKFFHGAGVLWQADVLTAGAELERLHSHFNDWQLALAAYNWGQRGVDRVERLDAHLAAGKLFSDLPLETRNYVTEVFADVPEPGAILPRSEERTIAPAMFNPCEHHLSRIESKLDLILRRLEIMSTTVDAALSEITADVTAETTVNQSVIALIQGIPALIAAAVAAATAAGATPAQLAAFDALSATMTANAAALAAAVTASTASATPAQVAAGQGPTPAVAAAAKAATTPTRNLGP